MYLFCLLLFPLAFLYYVVPRYAMLRSRFLISFFALVAAGIVCAFRVFFMFRSPYTGGNFLHFYAENLFACGIFPLLTYGFFLLVSRDDWRTKIESYGLFMLPFYAVYLPAEIFANPVPLPFFMLFVKPVLYLVMIVAVAGELRALFETVPRTKQRTALSALIILAEIAFPALVETFWHYAFSPVVWCGLVGVYIAACAFRTMKIMNNVQ